MLEIVDTCISLHPIFCLSLHSKFTTVISTTTKYAVISLGAVQVLNETKKPFISRNSCTICITFQNLMDKFCVQTVKFSAAVTLVL